LNKRLDGLIESGAVKPDFDHHDARVEEELAEMYPEEDDFEAKIHRLIDECESDAEVLAHLEEDEIELLVALIRVKREKEGR
jgi:uncharacterized protein with von Willebrand factor type A (vWA) domain